MGRVKEEPRGRLATLQDILADGGKRLVDQAQGLRVGIERRLVEVGRGVEGQVVALVGATEERLTERLDAWLNRLAVSLRKDVDRLRDRVRTLAPRKNTSKRDHAIRDSRG